MKLTLRQDFIYIALLGGLLLWLVGMDVNGLASLPGVLRLFLGLIFVLILPGYALQVVVFPGRGDLDGPERLALSIGLSMAVLPLLALFLDRLPWGIRLWPVLVAEGSFIAIASLVAVVRRRRLPESERFWPVIDLGVRRPRLGGSRSGRLLSAFLAGALSLTVLSAGFILVKSNPGEHFTEFYMLNSVAQAEFYPWQASSDEPLSVTLGLANRERDAHAYKVEVWVEDPWEDRRQKVAESDYKQLSPGEVLEWPLSWRMPWPGQDQKVEFLLFLDEDPTPYRALRLLLNVQD
jgi:uncharacterized membrane protein